jgi:hypothetical protein
MRDLFIVETFSRSRYPSLKLLVPVGSETHFFEPSESFFDCDFFVFLVSR